MKKALRVITNKYLLTTIAFLLLFLFFDQYDWFTQRARKKELEATKANIEFLQREISRMEKELKTLNTDPQLLEKYAREKYHEKRTNEDLYLIHIDTVSVEKK